ncbi:bifunctional nicotinamidase/pyrazinamidase [Betaproteobacteria bacterium PRO7]|jgi:nicotinamidase/pyrazinamidase|nr:bifunctional nicotinamidase/pyrazinamidase [Burkholderiaceae bacterium]MDL1861400.1 bifunctional nicotinamidase/pyrazinamidase [Betaproteobacteria bacterium PRO7]GIL06566.1 MAG: bifunctional pyrazinamidase/nicotinamidase [Betaproteobacteria bacterium]
MSPDSLLLVIDVQNDFLPGGALAVPRGDEVVAVINRIARKFENVILTQDWHTPNHVSFASSHPGKKPFETTQLAYGAQVLWPDHCVQGTRGADFAAALDVPHAQAIVRKGYHAHTDSYSAFVEADRQTPTGLAGLLRERGITTVYCCGLATDFCVAWSALDAKAAGFETYVIEDACRAIDTAGSLAAARAALAQAGVAFVTSDAL